MTWTISRAGEHISEIVNQTLAGAMSRRTGLNGSDTR